MFISYFSSSIYPSSKANAVHASCQVDALTKHFNKINFYCLRKTKNKKIFLDDLKDVYDVSFKNVNVISFYTSNDRFLNLKLGLYSSIYQLLFFKNFTCYSRNIYSSFFLYLFGFKVYNEIHLVESGWRSFIQKKLLKSNIVYNIVISSALKNFLSLKYKLQNLRNPINIFHDAGSFSISLKNENYHLLKKINKNATKNNFNCGYFGSIYEGRGIDVIISLAKKNPNFDFYIFHNGINNLDNSDVKNIYFSNLKFKEVKLFLSLFDVLLMPYQKSVSVAGNKYDTVKYMSPLKMFEYMLSGVPIISSNLSVLKEILINKKNSLLVPPNNISQWNSALNYIHNDLESAKILAKNAQNLALSQYTWDKRAYKILNLVNEKN